MEVRQLAVDDSIEYWNIRLRALKEEPNSFSASCEEDVNKPLADIIKRFREQWNSQENYILGAFKDGVLVGIVGFAREQRKKLRHKGNIWSMYVIPEARREGTGKLLLAEIIRRSHKLEGLEQINLTVTGINQSAKKTLRKPWLQVLRC